MGLRIGVVGAGGFAKGFVPLFQAHPLVESVALAELVEERRREYQEQFGIRELYPDYETLLAKADVDCVAIFTPRQLHGPIALAALNAGKHVYSAVPIAISVEEIKKIVEAVEKTRRIYMIGETCYYFPCAMYCRQAYREGKFGRFVYGESQYYHDMRHFYSAYQRSGGPDWKRLAGLPPFYYPTHSVGMLLSALDERAVKVTALGFRDQHADAVFGEGRNNWDNPFSNESMLMRLSGGGVGRINEFRRIGTKRPSSYITGFYGTEGAYECTSRLHLLQQLQGDEGATLTDVSRQINSLQFEAEREQPGYLQRSLDYNICDKDFSPIHNTARLPASFKGLPNGHNGSHQFLVDDFVKSVTTNRLPPNHVWSAARYMLPGLIGHESALRDGQPLDVPDFGEPPADWAMLNPDAG